MSFTPGQIEAEIARQDNRQYTVSQTGLIELALAEVTKDEDPTAAVNILEYVKASWGLDESPYPIQRALLKLIYGLPLDNEQRDIEIWDRFRENLVAKFTEEEFLDFLHKDQRCNLSVEDHKARLGTRITTVVFRLGRRGTKCVNSETLCHTSKGLLTLNELANLQGIKVPNGRGSLEGVDMVYNNGKAKTLKIETSLGTKLEGLPEHRLKVMSEEGVPEWRCFRDIEPGDYICHSRKNAIWGEEKPFSEDQFRLWGFYVGDGCVTESYFRTIAVQVNTETSEKAIVQGLMERVLGKVTFVPDKRPGKKAGRWDFYSTETRNKWRSLGFDYDVKQKGVPILVRSANESQQRAFLQGLFEADGCASGNRKLFFSCKGEKLADQVQLMLMTWNIISNKRWEVVDGEKYWRVEVHSNRDRRLYMEKIGFFSVEKTEAGWKTCEGVRETDAIPNQHKKVEEWYRELKPFGSYRDEWRSKFKCWRGEWNLTVSRLNEILEAFPQKVSIREHFEYLKRVDYAYSPVVSIKEGECETKDLSVPHGRTYIAAGMVSHNTTMSQWISAYEVYRLLKLRYPQGYYRLRQDQPIHITLVATGKDQAQLLLAPARAAIQRSPYLRRYVENDSAQKISLATQHSRDVGAGSTSGIHVQAAPCSARTVRGPANIAVLLEEFGSFFWELRGSNKSDISLYRALQPSTADFKNPTTGKGDGMIMIISTPLSRESHMYTIEQNIWEGDIKGLVLHIPSFWVNPNLTTEELKSMYATDRLGFLQEYEADYLDQVESAFSEEQMRAIHRPVDSRTRTIKNGESVWMGMDLGLKNDGTGISLVATDRDGFNRLVHHELWRTGLGKHDGLEYLSIQEMAERIDYLWEYWGCQGGVYDQWNAYGLESHLKSAAKKNLVHVEFNQTGNDRVARHTISVIQQRQLEIYGDETDWDDPDSVVKEFVRLQRIQTSGDPPKIKIQAPNIKGFHDDQYSSISRALWAAKLGVADHPPVDQRSSRQADQRSKAMRVRAETLRKQRSHTERNANMGIFRGRRT